MLRLRLLTAAIGLPLVLLAIAAGPLAFGCSLAFVAAVCTFELCRMAPGLRPADPLSVVAVGWSALLALRHFAGSDLYLNLALTAPLVLSLVLTLPTANRRPGFVGWAWTGGSALYVGWLLGHWGGLYGMPAGVVLVLFGMLTTFGYDTGAFFTGRSLGRHKLAPGISAAKTWEGVAGGVALAVCAGLLVRYVTLQLGHAFPFGSGQALVATVLLAVAAQVGDLVESALKRSANVKDAGGILPGHGGMMDRFDSLLFTGTMLYYFSLWTAL